MYNSALFGRHRPRNNVKKMCKEPNDAPNDTGVKVHGSARASVASVLQYTPPQYRKTKGNCYIEFYSFDPELGQLRRKRIRINRIKGAGNREKYAREVMKRICDQLVHGWNPWIAKDEGDLYTMEEGLTRYEAHIEKMLENGYYRKETYAGYCSNIKILREYIKKYRQIHYIYQFDRKFCVDFLDYVFIDRDNGAQTRNNYLQFLRVLSGFLVEKGYLKTRPTEGISPISKRLFAKERTCIPLDVIGKIAGYLKKEDPHFLLACYLLYYCFIRPQEMTRLQIRDFNIQASTVTIEPEDSKNHKKQTITLPKKVLLYAVDLGVFSAAMYDHLFSAHLRPGPEQIDPKHFRDHWAKVRRALKLKKEWKFYSLKDTGITAMLKDNLPSIDVRDQARHSSLSITEIYTDHRDTANPEIIDLDGAL